MGKAGAKVPAIKDAAREGSGGYLPMLLRLRHPGTGLAAPESRLPNAALSPVPLLLPVQFHSGVARWESG